MKFVTLCDSRRPELSLLTRASIWSTSIGVKSSSELVGLGLAMHTEGTVGMQFQLVGQVGDPIATVLLTGVRAIEEPDIETATIELDLR